MRRSTPGVFGGIEPHTPRVCGPKSNHSFRASSDESRRCVPPPVPCRNQPPPLPPKHHLRKTDGVDFNKHREPLEPLDSYGKYVYESISDSNASSQSNRNPTLPQSYATRDFPQSSATTPLGFRSISPRTLGLSCGGRNMPGHAPYDAKTFRLQFPTSFVLDPSSEFLKGPCTCSLGTGGGANQQYNQSPVWSKMPSVAGRLSDATQSKTSGAVSGGRNPSRQEKKPISVDTRPWTISRFSRTMSRFFRWKVSHRKSKSNSMRSRSVYFSDFPENFNVDTARGPSSPNTMCSPPSASPAVTLPSSQFLPLPPTVPTGEADTSTSPILRCRDVAHHQQLQTITAVSTSTEAPICGSPSAISCVHHVHHIHHVHHVHHHLHHMPQPPPLPPVPRPASGSQGVTSPAPATDDAAALIMMLENAATLGETPPPSLPLSILKDSKSTEHQAVGNAGNSHTYSAYGVRGGTAPVCCPISSSPPPPPPPPPPLPSQTSASALHRQNTTVCSNPRCITAHCRRRRVQGSPGDHLRTPTSIELAELAEVGAEAVFSNGGNGGRTTTMTTTTRTTSSSSCTDPLPSSSPNATSVVPSCPNSPAPANSATAGGTGASATRLMHHMHHHHMHHMLHHLRPPSTTPAPANTLAIPSAHSTPVSPPAPGGSAVSNSAATPDHRSSFQESMKALRKMGWYWGPLSFTEAEKLLANRPDGTFLVRDSAHDTFFLSLSFRVRGTTYHTRIEHSQGRFSFWFEPESHSASTVVEFIEKAVAHSIGGKYHYFLQTSTPGQQPVEVSLLYPLSRFQVVQSLKHLARFTILSHVRRDHVARLPLPPGQIGYLLEKQVYWESLEDFEETIRDRPPLQFTPVSASSPEKP